MELRHALPPRFANQTAWSFPIAARMLRLKAETHGAVVAETLLWRRSGRLWATIVAKATFTIAPGAVADLRAPEAIVFHDVHARGDRRTPAITPSEVAPWMPKAEVFLNGRAHAPAGVQLQRCRVSLGVRRGRATLVSKELFVYADDGPFSDIGIGYDRALATPENPAGRTPPRVLDPTRPHECAGFGPIARTWPSRSHKLAVLGTTGSIVEVPEDFDGSCFQAAPADQRVEVLHGDETIQIDGMHRDHASVCTRLPGATVRIRVGDHAIPTRIGMLLIDMDRMVCSLVWSGSIEIADPTSIETMVAEVSLHLDALASQNAPGTEVPVAPSTSLGKTAPLAPTARVSTLPFENDASAVPKPKAQLGRAGALGRDFATHGVRPVPGAPWTSSVAPAVPRAIPSQAHTLIPGVWESAEALAPTVEVAPELLARPVATPRAQSVEAGAVGVVAPKPLGNEGSGQDGRGLDEYAWIRLELDRAPNRSEALRRLGVEPSEWSRLDRHWRRRALTDGSIARQLREKIASYRRKQ